jgi:hypothetical protein
MATTIPAGMTFGQWHDSIPSLATGSPYDASSFGNTLNNIGSQATQNFNAYLGASPGMQSAGVQPLTHTDLDPSVANQVANAWLQQAQAGSGAGSGAAAPMSSGFGFSSNPYLGKQSDAIRAQQAQLFGDMNNQITSGAVAAGGLGGSRQGVAQGVAEARAATGLDSALANMYGNAYNTDQSLGLQQYLGDQSFFTAQRGQDLAQTQLGASLYGLGTQGQWTPYQQFNSTLSPYTGFGTTTASAQQGGGALGALGGALGTAQLGNQLGWWGK